MRLAGGHQVLRSADIRQTGRDVALSWRLWGRTPTSANLSCLGLKWHANFWEPHSGQLPVGRRTKHPHAALRVSPQLMTFVRRRRLVHDDQLATTLFMSILESSVSPFVAEVERHAECNRVPLGALRTGQCFFGKRGRYVLKQARLGGRHSENERSHHLSAVLKALSMVILLALSPSIVSSQQAQPSRAACTTPWLGCVKESCRHGRIRHARCRVFDRGSGLTRPARWLD